MGSQNSVNRRFGFFILFTLVLVGLLGVRLVDFQVVQAAEIKEKSMERRSVTQTLTALRGQIEDSSGQILARTVFRYDVNVAPKNVAPVIRYSEDGTRTEIPVEQITQELAKLLNIPAQEIAPKLVGDSQYANLAKRVDAETYSLIRELRVPWIYFDRFADRLYPNGAVAGNLLGFVGADAEPLAGLERQYNTCLAGVDGQETYERSAEGVRIPASSVVTQPIQNGGNLKLTIDSNLQFFAQQVLADSVRDLSADWASAVVMEVKTGKIIVAAEAPSVDPNDPAASKAQDRGSRIFQSAFEPGSVMKALTVAMVLDTNAANETEKVKAPYSLKLDFPGGSVQDSFGHETYYLTLGGVLRYSSNTATVQFGRKIDKEVRYEYLKKFGFGKQTALRFEGESSGILHPVDEWDKMTNFTTMFGQGISVTGIQMASAYQAIANGGVKLDPILVAGCAHEDGKVTMQPKQSSVRVLSEAKAKNTLELLEKVVEFGGVGKNAAIPGYRVGGKTGTAQVQEGSGYGRRFAISFYGVAPIEDPQYVVGVTIFRPVGETNSMKTTPVFKAIMQQVLKHYRVPPSTTKSRDIPSGPFGEVEKRN